MPAGNDIGSSRSSASSKKNAHCSFCRKNYRDVGPLVEGPGDVYITAFQQDYVTARNRCQNGRVRHWPRVCQESAVRRCS